MRKAQQGDAWFGQETGCGFLYGKAWRLCIDEIDATNRRKGTRYNDGETTHFF